MSKPIRISVWVFALLAALYLAAAGVMSTAWFQHTLQRQVEANLERTTGARVTIRQFRFRPLVFESILSGLVLHGRESAGEPPLVSAGTLVVRISPRFLLGRGLRLRSLDIESTDIHLHTYSDGSTNLPGPAVSTDQALQNFLNLRIGRLVVSRTNFFLDDQRIPLEFSARQVAVDIGFQRGGHYIGGLSSSAIEVASVPHLPPLTLAARVDLARGGLTLSSLVWRAAGIAAQGSLDLRLPSLETNLVLRVSGPAQPLIQALRLPGFSGGDFRGEGEAAFRGGKLRVQGALDAQNLTVRNGGVTLRPVSFSLAGSTDLHTLELSRIKARLLGGSIEGSGRIDLSRNRPALALDAKLNGIEITPVLESAAAGSAAELFPISTRASGSWIMEWNGARRVSASRFDLTFEPPRQPPAVGHAVSGFLRGSATFGPREVVRIDNAELRTAHSSLKAQGALDSSAPGLNFEVETSDFEDWRRLAELFAQGPVPATLDSTASFSGHVSGRPDSPEIHGKLAVGPFEFRGSHWDAFQGSITATPGVLQVSSGKLQEGASTLGFDLKAGLVRWEFTLDAPLQISAVARGAPLAGLRHALGVSYPLEGTVSGRVDLHGLRSSLSGSGSVRVDQGVFSGEPFDSLAAGFQVSRSLWNVPSVRLVKGAGQAQGQARFDIPERTFSASAHGLGFSLTAIHALNQLEQEPRSPLPENLRGQLEFDLTSGGTFDLPHFEATVALTGLEAEGTPLGDLKGQARWKKSRLHLAADLLGAGGSVHLEGDTGTQGDWPASFTLQCRSLGVNRWAPQLHFAELGAELMASGTAHLDGPLKNPAALNLAGEFQTLKVSFPELSWQNDRPVQLTVQAGTLRVSRFSFTGPSTSFQVEGWARFTAPTAINFTAQGQVDTSLLATANPNLLTAGRFDVEVHASGSLEQPSYYGAVRARGVSLAYPGLPLRLSGLNGDIRLEGNRLTVTSLQGAAGQGSISVSGFADLSGAPRFDLRADLKGARVQYPLDFTSTLTGRLALVGSSSGGALSGNLAVEQMAVSENFNLLNWLGALSNRIPAQLTGAASPAASRFRMNVSLHSAPLVTLDSHDLSLVADVDLSMRGTLAEPVLFGNIHLQSGRAILRGTSYTITRGDITMANPARTQTVLDLEATTRIQRYDITMSVTGPAERPALAYRSEPPLPTPDILGLLAFGYSSQEQLQSATGRSTFGTLGANALLSQLLSAQTSGRIQRLFGLSRISIDPNPSGLGGARVTVQEQVTRDFSILYTTTTGQTQERITQVEWDLSDKVSLLGVRDQNGVYGVELDFRHRFK